MAYEASGISDLKKFLSSQSWYWNDRGEVRDEKSLSAADVAYLREWTMAPFGIAHIFYFASPRRKLYDILAVYIAGYLFSEVSKAFIQSDIVAGPTFLVLLYLLLILFLSGVSLYNFYVSFRHSRRLSWNRGNWKSVDELRKSEDKWLRYNFLPSVIVSVLILFFGFRYFL